MANIRKPTLSREEHSKLLTGSLRSAKSPKPEPLMPEPPLRPAEPEMIPPVQDADKPWSEVQQSRQSITLEQPFQYNPGSNRPMVSVKVRLTTAHVGERRERGMAEAVYVLRLEVLEASGEACVEGFALGPWQVANQAWGPGAVYVAEPLLAGFGPQFGPLQGRIQIYDQERNRLLDMPWQTEGIFPGTKSQTV